MLVWTTEDDDGLNLSINRENRFLRFVFKDLTQWRNLPLNYCIICIKIVYEDYQICSHQIIVLSDFNTDFTDSFVCNVMNINGYPEFDYYYKLLNDIFSLSNILANYHVNIELVKIPSHSGIFGNRMADKFAGYAAQLSRDCKFGKNDFILYNLYYNPINVDISKDLIRLRKWQRLQRKEKWLLRHDKWCKSCIDDNIFLGGMIFHKLVINDGVHILNGNSNMRNELKYLKPFEAGIICKLRTEHINLNSYKSFRFGDTNGLCRYCNVYESVEHFLIDCPGQSNILSLALNWMDCDYNICRNKLKSRLKRIDIFFKNKSHFTVSNLLFPHSWQKRPYRSDPNYKIKCDAQLLRRVRILQEVINFVKLTKRFCREKYGF